MPILNGTFLCFKMCAHLGTFLKSLQFHTFYTLKVHNYFYVIFTILCDGDVVLFVYTQQNF